MTVLIVIMASVGPWPIIGWPPMPVPQVPAIEPIVIYSGSELCEQAASWCRANGLPVRVVAQHSYQWLPVIEYKGRRWDSWGEATKAEILETTGNSQQSEPGAATGKALQSANAQKLVGVRAAERRAARRNGITRGTPWLNGGFGPPPPKSGDATAGRDRQFFH